MLLPEPFDSSTWLWVAIGAIQLSAVSIFVFEWMSPYGFDMKVTERKKGIHYYKEKETFATRRKLAPLWRKVCSSLTTPSDGEVSS